MGKRGRPVTVSPAEARRREREYQKKYYQEHKKERSAYLKHLRATNPEFRQKEILRARRARALARAEKAEDKIAEAVEARKNAKTRYPRYVELDGERLWVYGNSHLGKMVGRTTETVRVWLANRVIPGCSLWVGDRAYYTEPFMEAVRDACEEMYRLDGRGSRQVLQRLVREELNSRGIPWVVREGKAQEPVDGQKARNDEKENNKTKVKKKGKRAKKGTKPKAGTKSRTRRKRK